MFKSPNVLLLQVETQNRHRKDLVDPGITSAPVGPDLGISHAVAYSACAVSASGAPVGCRGPSAAGCSPKLSRRSGRLRPGTRFGRWVAQLRHRLARGFGCQPRTGTCRTCVLVTDKRRRKQLPKLFNLRRTSCKRPIAHHGRCLDGLFPAAKLCIQQFSRNAHCSPLSKSRRSHRPRLDVVDGLDRK